MPVQVGWFELGCQDRFDLRPEFQFQFIEPDLSQKLVHVLKQVEMPGLINQRRDFVATAYRSPPIIHGIPDNRKMNAERNSWIFRKQPHRVS